MSRSLATRGLPAALALALCVWFAFLQRDTHLLDRSTDPAGLYGRLHTGAGYRQAVRDIHDSRRLNPARDPDVVLADLLFFHFRPGDRPRALRIALGVAHREPENFLVWQHVLTYANAIGRHDAAGEARARLRALDPLDTRALP